MLYKGYCRFVIRAVHYAFQSEIHTPFVEDFSNNPKQRDIYYY